MSSTIVRQQESHQEIAEVSINSCVSACEKSNVWRTAMILGNQPTELPIGCKPRKLAAGSCKSRAVFLGKTCRCVSCDVTRFYVEKNFKTFQ